jgi:hypothetical protein
MQERPAPCNEGVAGQCGGASTGEEPVEVDEDVPLTEEASAERRLERQVRGNLPSDP